MCIHTFIYICVYVYIYIYIYNFVSMLSLAGVLRPGARLQDARSAGQAGGAEATRGSGGTTCLTLLVSRRCSSKVAKTAARCGAP